MSLFTCTWRPRDYRRVCDSLRSMGLTRVYLYFPHRRFNNGLNRGRKPGDAVRIYRNLNGIKVNNCCAHADLDEWEAWFQNALQRQTTHGDYHEHY